VYIGLVAVVLEGKEMVDTAGQVKDSDSERHELLFGVSLGNCK